VYLGGKLLPTAGETIVALRRQGRRVLFLSNNPTHTRAAYSERLTRLGLPTPPEDVLTSAVILVDFLKRTLADGARLFVIGEAALETTLREAGYELVDAAERTDAVIASFDRTFTYRKLQIGFDALRAGARFFATNPDKYCPVPGTAAGGRPAGEPDCAAIIAALEACTDVQCEAVVGKPSAHTIQAALQVAGLPAGECLMTGDRLETDVLMGLDAGMSAALTLTGATPLSALASSSVQPTYVIEGLGDLLI
jgi:NagD protein